MPGGSICSTGMEVPQKPILSRVLGVPKFPELYYKDSSGIVQTNESQNATIPSFPTKQQQLRLRKRVLGVEP